jgi:ABC transporter substrate binding protein
MRRREFITLIGAAAAWPLATRAQQPALPLIGYLSGRSPEDTVRELEAFHKGLSEGGFVSGGNVNIEFRWARGDYGRLSSLAAELVQQGAAVLAATGGDASARAAKQATATIPVVFNMGGDPVEAGLVQSFNRPGGNVTGSSILSQDMEQKRFGILRTTVRFLASALSSIPILRPRRIKRAISKVSQQILADSYLSQKPATIAN